MKKIYTTVVAVIAIFYFAPAQNTFPIPPGNVGIRESNPENSISFKRSRRLEEQSKTLAVNVIFN